MNSTGFPSNCTLMSNPDISGIGVRVSVYVQGFISLIAPIVFDSVEDIENTGRNAFLTSAAIIATAFIQAGSTGGLALVDGIVVTFLTNIIILGSSLTALRRLRTSGLTFTLASMAQVALWLAFGLKLWVDVDTFGATPGCNTNAATQFVVFGKSIGATSHVARSLGIAMIVLTLLLGGPAALAPLLCECSAPRQRRGVPGAGVGTGGLRTVRHGVFAYVEALVGIVGVWVYHVVTTEQIISRNGVSQSTGQWTFGQTLSMFLLIGPVVDVVRALSKRCQLAAIRRFGRVGAQVGRKEDGNEEMKEDRNEDQMEDGNEEGTEDGDEEKKEDSNEDGNENENERTEGERKEDMV